MRKVLLATTALVAMGGVSAASADISISGFGRYTYASWSDNATTGDDTTGATDVHFTVSGASTADSGMTMGGSITIANGASDGRSIYISDDWGKLTFGGNGAGRSSHNSASVGGMPGTNTDAWTTAIPSSLAANSRIGTGYTDASTIKYTSPDFNGLVVNLSVNNKGAGASEQNDQSEWSVSYDTAFEGASVGVDYASSSTAAASGSGTTTDANSVGATVVVDDLTIMVGSSNNDKSDGTSKVATTDYGVDYAVNSDLTVEAWAVSSKNTGTTAASKDDKLTMTQVGATYTVTPGLTVSLTSRSFDFKDAANVGNNKGDSVTARVTVTF